ncbi:hypothetical protein BGX27_003221 [Mortierella sp. AM989]|nr:hypothetical protein BGX27_003221 [Mortierella sp. AM989]
MSTTAGGSEGNGGGSYAIIPSLVSLHPVLDNSHGDSISNHSSNPVLQSSVSLPTLASLSGTSLQQRVIGATDTVDPPTTSLSLSKDSSQQKSGFNTSYHHQSLQHCASEQQQQRKFQSLDKSDGAPSPLSSYSVTLKEQAENEEPNASSLSISLSGTTAQKSYIQHNNTMRCSTSAIISSPESPPSSESSSAFHSPSTSITWASPSANNHGSPMTVSYFAPLSERGNQSQSKGKGVARSYRYSRRRAGRACFDGLPREIKIHIFRYLSTFQLVRVSRVNRSWRGLAMDGSLWKVIDTTRYYKSIQDSQLRILGTAASGFLRYMNFRGCVQLSGDSLSAIAEHCPNIERLHLTGCRAVTSKSIADVCINMPLLLHLELAGLQSVNNHTLQTMAVYCRSLQILNLAWCKQISGSGLIKLTRSCQELRKLNISGCSNLEDRLMPMMGMNLPKLRELCLNGCSSLTDRGLIGLLSGLSVGSSKKHRKWRMKKRMSSSVRVSSLGHLLINQSSCNDDDDDGEEEQDKEDEAKEEEESDRESDADDEGADAEDGNETTNGSPMQLSSTSTNTSSQNTQRNKDGLQARLVYLGLSQCRLLTHEALRAIGHLCGQHLRRLELSSCENFGDEGLVHLSQHCSRLRLLDLEDVNLLTDVSLRAFAMHLPRLERLCISYCENVTDQGIIRMLRPAPNPTTLSTATAMMINAETASLYCRKLIHLELDNCLLITDQLLLEFANVLEERAVATMERQRERERRREERRERIRQKKKAVVLQKQSGRQSTDKGEEEHSPRSSCDQTGIEQGQDALIAGSSNMGSLADVSFISSIPVNIPNRFRHTPAIAGSSLPAYSSSPLQPRGVLASTLLSEEVVIKKTRPGTRIMVPTRSTSTLSTASCGSLPLWHSAASSRRNSSSVAISRSDRKPNGVAAKRPLRPTIQVFDCRNITLEGVEAAQTRCSSLTIRSYYSWTHPSTSAPTTSVAFGGSGATEGIDGEDADADDDDATSDNHNNTNSSQTSLHHLQLQQQHLQQHLQHRGRASSLLRRARLGLIGRDGGMQDAQCTIL